MPRMTTIPAASAEFAVRTYLRLRKERWFQNQFAIVGTPSTTQTFDPHPANLRAPVKFAPSFVLKSLTLNRRRAQMSLAFLLRRKKTTRHASTLGALLVPRKNYCNFIIFHPYCTEIHIRIYLGFKRFGSAKTNLFQNVVKCVR